MSYTMYSRRSSAYIIADLTPVTHGPGVFIGEVVRRIFQEYSLLSVDEISFQG